MTKSRAIVLICATILLIGLSSMSFMQDRWSSRQIRQKDLSGLKKSGVTAPIAGLSAPLNLAKLLDESDVVGVGEVVAMSDDRLSQTEVFHQYEATVRLDKVLKGSIPSIVSVKLFKRRNDFQKGKKIGRSLYAMFFLKEQSPGSYSPTDPTVEAVIATNRGQIKKDDALVSVIDVLSEVLRSNSSESDRAEAITALASVNVRQSNEALHLVLNDSSESLKLQAEAVLLRHGDVSVLPLVEEVLLKQADTATAAKISTLSFAIQLGVRDPTGIPVLTHLLTSPNSEVRRAAVHGLRETRALPAVSPLATALNDSDQMVRYDAVLGLSEITGDRSHAPSVDTFKSDEKKYVAYWRAKF